MFRHRQPGFTWPRGFSLAAWADTLALGRQCEVCRNWSHRSLCDPCLSHFAPVRARCTRCALLLPEGPPSHTFMPICPRCMRLPQPQDRDAQAEALGASWSRACCAVDYAYPWDRMIARLKFGGASELAWPLSGLIVRALDDQGARAGSGGHITPEQQVDGIVAVPLSAPRLALRGYNQSWELARAVARRLGRPAHPRALQRHGSLTPQAQAQRQERLRRQQGAFIVPTSARHVVAGRRLALIDDVMTTGATLQAATAALLEAGAAEVQVWAVARTA